MFEVTIKEIKMTRKNACISSGLNTATNATIMISTTGGMLHGVMAIVNTTADPIVIIYDNSSARAGNIIYRRQVDSSVQGKGGLETFPNPVAFIHGCALSVTGTDGADGAIVYVAPKGA